MKKYITGPAILSLLCLGTGAQNYIAGPMHIGGALYDASAGNGSSLTANNSITVGSSGSWLFNTAVLQTPRTGTSQTAVIRFNSGSYTRSSGFVNGYVVAENQTAGFVLPVGHSGYMPLTIQSALTPGTTITAAWYDNQLVSSAPITEPGSGATIPYYFLPGYYDLSASSAGLSITTAVPAAAIAATRVVGTTNGTSFVDLGPAGSAITLPTGNYRLAFANSAYALPLTLTAFTAMKQVTAGLLSWNTKQEQNMQFFIVERSADGRRYTALDSLPSLGNSTQGHQYQLRDAQPYAGANYYRLKMTETGGKISYSAVRVLNFNGSVNIAFYPNPVTEKAFMTGLEAGMQVTVLNLQGQVLISRQASGNTMEIPMGHLPSAVYQLQVQDRNGKMIGGYRIAKD